MSTDIIAIVMDDSVMTASIFILGSFSDDGGLEEGGCSAAC